MKRRALPLSASTIYLPIEPGSLVGMHSVGLSAVVVEGEQGHN